VRYVSGLTLPHPVRVRCTIAEPCRATAAGSYTCAAASAYALPSPSPPLPISNIILNIKYHLITIAPPLKMPLPTRHYQQPSPPKKYREQLGRQAGVEVIIIINISEDVNVSYQKNYTRQQGQVSTGRYLTYFPLINKSRF
jgi:hypothetical protein